MSSCAAQLFSGFTVEHFTCLVAKANAAGLDISGNTGSASRDGVTVAWVFDPGAQTLSIQCTSAPFFVSCGAVNSKIHDLIDSCS